MSVVSGFFTDLINDSFLGEFFADPLAGLLPLVIFISRLVLAFLAVLIVARCAISLLKDKNEPETWAWLGLGDGVRVPIQHWENIIGRGSSADIMVPLPEVSRNHAALIREEKGGWQLIDIANKHNIAVNGEPLQGSLLLEDGDVIEIAGSKMSLAEITPEEEEQLRANRTRPGKKVRPGKTLCWLTLFLAIMGLELSLAIPDHALMIVVGFLALIVLMWLAWLISRSFKRTGFEIETLGFFLTGVGLAVVCSNDPAGIDKHMLTVVLGVLGFFFLQWVLRDLQRVKSLRWIAAGLALALMAAVFLFGQEIYGARNWISLGGFSIQPSELVKVLFIFAGGATLDRLFARRNLYSFIVMSAAIVGVLALISDFGTAAIFFAVYIVIAYLRSGDWQTIALSLSGAVLAVLVVLAAKPYVADRFATWGHAWDFVTSGGYQQTRAMTVVASGGLFGMGGGEGWLKYVAASETDLVFAFVCEEWGLIIAVCALAALVVIALFAVRSAYNARSSYYVVVACGTAALMLVQTMLNVGGSLDILPLTGVTFPFISTGGSSMLACWCMLAFLKAADTRQNASFAIKLKRKKRRQRANAPVIAAGPEPAETFPEEAYRRPEQTADSGLRLPGEPLPDPGRELQLPQLAPEPEPELQPWQFPGTPPDISGRGNGGNE